MLCSPMMIPPHPPRRLDPPLGQSRFGKDFPESCVNHPGSGSKKNVTPLVGVPSVWGAENFKIVYLSKTSLVPKILVPPTPR